MTGATAVDCNSLYSFERQLYPWLCAMFSCPSCSSFLLVAFLGRASDSFFLCLQLAAALILPLPFCPMGSCTMILPSLLISISQLSW